MIQVYGNRYRRFFIARLRTVLALACLTLLLAPTPYVRAEDAQAFPSKPVRIFVPYGAGGVGDLTMRLLAQQLSEDVGQQFVIENRPGAGGSISAMAALTAAPDGYSLAVTGNGQAISMTLFKSRTYDVLNDFTQVSITGTFEMLLAVKQDSPFKNLQDIVDFARKNPGKLNVGAVNPGSTQNLSAHLFKQTTGAEVTIIPYKTTPDVVTAILRNDIQMGFDFYAGFQGSIADKQLRILATSGEHRNPLLKGVPTAVESGLPDYIVTSWNGLSGRAGLPEPILKKLNGLIVKALDAPSVREKGLKLGIDMRGSTPKQMHDRMANDIVKWRRVIE
ncbi:MAG: tripartite tricarboxylate transporter substrate binding protein, partial [Rhizobiales bacterium]|nr:tripartite tricarboxylate transporter substrate binding protein [Hyphomicrobiales bacterium]